MSSDAQQPAAGPHKSRGPAPVYRITVEGQLDLERAAWFDGLTIMSTGGVTILTGTMPDQPALFGVLLKVRDLGLDLISVERLDGLAA